MKRIGFIGIGNMGEALYSGFVAGGKLTPELAYAYTPNREELAAKVEKLGLTGCDSLASMLEQVDMIVIACKPAQVQENAREILFPSEIQGCRPGRTRGTVHHAEYSRPDPGWCDPL